MIKRRELADGRLGVSEHSEDVISSESGRGTCQSQTCRIDGGSSERKTASVNVPDCFPIPVQNANQARKATQANHMVAPATARRWLRSLPFVGGYVFCSLGITL
jgi:hypothetical protein